MKKKIHEKEVQKLRNSDLRHQRNMLEELRRTEIKSNKNEEKVFKKYMSFYFIRKDKEKEMKKRIAANKNKALEKGEKIEELERNTQLKTEKLMKKLKDIEKRKTEIMKKKMEEFKQFNQRREVYNKSCVKNKKILLQELSDERLDVLDYQTSVINKGLLTMKTNELKRMNLTEKTILNNQNFEKNLKPFYKKLESIKSKSIQKKTEEECKKMYINKKKAEEEAKRKEKEDKLLIK